jgi:hypothetical protein
VGTRPRSRFFETVGVAFEGDDFCVVHEPVDRGGGDDVVAEHFAPAAEGLVAGDDQGGAFVAGGHQLEDQVGGFGFEGDVADLVDDEQRVAADPDEFLLEASGVVGHGEPGDPLGGGGEQHAVAGLAGADGQPDSTMLPRRVKRLVAVVWLPWRVLRGGGRSQGRWRVSGSV